MPLRTGGKKMRKRRELDALVEHSLAKRYKLEILHSFVFFSSFLSFFRFLFSKIKN